MNNNITLKRVTNAVNSKIAVDGVDFRLGRTQNIYVHPLDKVIYISWGCLGNIIIVNREVFEHDDKMQVFFAFTSLLQTLGRKPMAKTPAKSKYYTKQSQNCEATGMVTVPDCIKIQIIPGVISQREAVKFANKFARFLGPWNLSYSYRAKLSKSLFGR